MKMKSALLAATLAPALFVNTAHAAATASASISIVEVVLTDLDVNDGITPSLQFMPDSGFTKESASVSYRKRAPGSPFVSNTVTEEDNFKPLDAQMALGNVLSGSATKRGDTFETLGFASDLSAGASDIRSAAASTSSYIRFLLSPNTKLSITFAFDVQADSVPGESQSANAAAWLNLSLTEAPRPLPLDQYLLLTYEENALGEGEGQPGPATYTANWSTGNYTPDLNLQMYTSAGISPVPEPHTYSMLLAGLMLAGAAGIRRGRKQ